MLTLGVLKICVFMLGVLMICVTMSCVPVFKLGVLMICVTMSCVPVFRLGVLIALTLLAVVLNEGVTIDGVSTLLLHLKGASRLPLEIQKSML